MQPNDDLNARINQYVIESLALLRSLEESVSKLETDSNGVESVHNILCTIHTILASANELGLNDLVQFSHVVDSVLDQLCVGKIDLSSDLVATLIASFDHIGQLLNASIDSKSSNNTTLNEMSKVLTVQLHAYLEGNLSSQKQSVEASVSQVEIPQSSVESMGSDVIDNGNWHLSLRFGIDSLRNGMDPLAFIRYLNTLGKIAQLTTITQGIPLVSEMDPETSYLGFEIDLKSEARKEEIESVFEFVRDDSQIYILPNDSCLNEFLDLINALPEDNLFIGEILVKSGLITQRELEEGLGVQKKATEEEEVSPPLGEILVEQHAIQSELVSAALDKQKQIKENKVKENQSIRVDAERLDRLIDLIGELVISGAGVNLRASQTADQALIESTGEVMRLVEEVRDNALQLRMVPIGTTFSRFQRVVRDVSKELGKEIDLVITGGETEVDKSVVEKIGDPLMHLVRNSIDHGIETADVRLDRGKPMRGTLNLNAYHESGSIAIEVIDDGGGLNRDKIISKAIEKGLVQPGVNLSDQEIYALIFEPGFSTAQQVSNLSGRGVGMDVVKRNVNDLRGMIEVESQNGVGTTIRIRLPLTLAIIDGFLVSVGESSFVIPLDRVDECVELPFDINQRQYMDLRGEVLPLIRIRSLFNIEGSPARRENVVVVEYGGVRTGFIVDRLMGEFQTVIKPLGKLFQYIKGVAGSTILGNGKVALILDVSTLVGLISHRNVSHTSHQAALMHQSHLLEQQHYENTSLHNS